MTGNDALKLIMVRIEELTEQRDQAQRDRTEALAEAKKWMDKVDSSTIKTWEGALRDLGERPSGGGGSLDEYSQGARDARQAARDAVRKRIKKLKRNDKEIRHDG